MTRPESTIAQSFAADLDDMFGLAPSDAPRRTAPTSSDDPSLHTAGVSGLVEQVDQKKQDLSTKDAELQALEAKLKEAEERLKKVSRNASPARGNTVPIAAPATAGASALPQANVGAARNPPSALPSDSPAESLAQKAAHPLSRSQVRPPTQSRTDTQQLMSGMPGYMPPETPGVAQGAGSGDYVMVDSEQERR